MQETRGIKKRAITKRYLILFFFKKREKNNIGEPFNYTDIVMPSYHRRLLKKRPIYKNEKSVRILVEVDYLWNKKKDVTLRFLQNIILYELSYQECFMKVMKFGGSSVADGPRIKDVAAIVKRAAEKETVFVVLSAMKGNTDLLIAAAKKAEIGDKGYKEIIDSLSKKNTEAIQYLFNKKDSGSVLEKIKIYCEELFNLLRGIELVRECSPRSLDLVTSFGERMNCYLFSEYLKYLSLEAEYVDTRGLIITDNSFGNGKVLFKETYRALKEKLQNKNTIPIITGFIGSTKEGITTTLGRNGSDYTASIVGAALNCSEIEIWTDVDGVLSADPRIVEEAFVVPEVSFQEAMELSYFGAKVIHPYTMIPAVEKNIPLHIKNTLNPSAPGTRINKEIQPHNRMITGLASISSVAIVNVVGGGMLGIPGIGLKVFSAVARAGINIIMISQASSEHSICLVFKENEAERAVEILKQELSQELLGKMIQDVEIIRGLEIIAVIGENMRGRPGLAGRVFSALGSLEINVLAIAQGSSELNISFVIRSQDTKKALKGIHNSFLG